MAAVYKVVAPLVLVKDEARRITYAYEGALVRLLPFQAEQFLAENLVEESDGELSDEPVDGEQALTKPGSTAKKPELVAWVVDNLAKDDGSDYTTDEAEALKVDELRALIESVE